MKRLSEALIHLLVNVKDSADIYIFDNLLTDTLCKNK